MWQGPDDRYQEAHQRATEGAAQEIGQEPGRNLNPGGHPYAIDFSEYSGGCEYSEFRPREEVVPIVWLEVDKRGEKARRHDREHNDIGTDN